MGKLLISSLCRICKLAVTSLLQIPEMKTRLEEKIRALENEKRLLLEEISQLREVVGLSEKAKSLEAEVDKLRAEAKALKERIPRELFKEFTETVAILLSAKEKEKPDDECAGCEEETF